MIITKRISRSITALLITAFVFSLFGMSPQSTNAQYFADVSLTINPSYPKVGEMVTVTASSADVNLGFQNLTWYVNGKMELSGPAETSVIFQVEDDIPSYNVRVVIGNTAGQIVRELTFSPGEVILLWEAVDSYTPKWYRGKALLPSEGLVRITAIPVGSKSLDNLYFVWRKGNDSLGSQSGYARNSIIVNNSILNDQLSVSVEVSSGDGSYSAYGELEITPTLPDVRLWAPRFGITPVFESDNVLAVSGADEDIEAIPYYFPTDSNKRGLAFDWKLNSQEFRPENDLGDSIFIARSPAPISVELLVQSYKHILQEARVYKTIIFK